MNTETAFRVLALDTNVGVLSRDGRHLLIGCAPPSTLRRAGIEPAAVEWVLLTHHHRTAAPGLADLAAAGVQVAVPEEERRMFEAAGAYWADDGRRWHAYDFHPSTRTLRENVPVSRTLSEDRPFEWRGVTVRTLRTPGPSAGGMSVLVGESGTLTAFVGELICADGKLRDFHLLQGRRPLPGGELMEYHGFGERTAGILSSLERVLQARPAHLVPTFGPVIRDPARAVARLRARVTACLRNYHAVSSGRWYFPGAWPDVPDITADLRRRCRSLPPWVVEVGGTSRAIRAADGTALLLDCAGDAPTRVKRLQTEGRLGRVEHLWITHYHDDHVDHANAFRSEQGCGIIAHATMADVLRHPVAYNMPCLDPRPIPPDRVTSDGETWEWRGFRLTAFDLPGQTIYDAALLVERDGVRVLFTGDSFTPGGLDDYCTRNRNLIGEGVGYDRCLRLLDRLGPDVLLVNQHVEGAFVFSKAEVEEMRRNLDERRRLFTDLLDWEDPDFGLDPNWARLEPYYQRSRAVRIEWEAVIENHARTPRRFRVELRCPREWSATKPSAELTVAGRSSGRCTLSAEPGSASGRWVVGLAVRMDRRDLGEIAEGVVDVK
jgi:glyoxylase-like metal-dependent hydrolase (beta-lactamase superfamily II)